MTPIEILLVEDSQGDIRLTQEALRESRIVNELRVVTDGAAAIRYLFKQDEFADASSPDLILLDLNLPKKNGMEVLREIKSRPETAVIPVVMLTTSTAEEDIMRSYQLFVNAYISKPVRYEDFLLVIRSIENFWISLVKLPTRTSRFKENEKSS
jgi:two-component system response regulator